LTLTVEKARELAKALVSVAEAIEFVNTPAGSLHKMADAQYKENGLSDSRARTARPE
jgi:hypothetical protein